MRTLKRLRTHDSLNTYDRATIDSAGAFLVGELERLDPMMHEPLVDVTWGRDIDLRGDVSMADETSSYSLSTFGAPGLNPAGKNWIGKKSGAVAGIELDISKIGNPMTLWGMELAFTIIELMKAQQVGRPIDTQKLQGLRLKFNMDVDEQVYIGDADIGAKGLCNATAVAISAVNPGVGGNTFALKTPDEILADFNTLLTDAWAATGFAICPSHCLMPPVQFGLLATMKVSNAGNISVLEYIKQNCISNARNGRPLVINPLKWLTGRGAAGADRMVAYTKDPVRVRYPLVPMQRTPVSYSGLKQSSIYYANLGVVEAVYPETIRYMDGI